jgi:putative oxidoreductase
MFQRWHDYAALPLRAAIGAIFVVHGTQKLFGWFGGAGLESTASFLASYGLVPGPAWALVAGVAELAGGIALLLGFLTRWAAIGLAIRTVVALVLVNAPAGFSATQGGIEIPLALLGGLLALACTGGQQYALDAQVPALGRVSPVTEPSVKKAA